MTFTGVRNVARLDHFPESLNGLISFPILIGFFPYFHTAFLATLSQFFSVPPPHSFWNQLSPGFQKDWGKMLKNQDNEGLLMKLCGNGGGENSKKGKWNWNIEAVWKIPQSGEPLVTESEPGYLPKALLLAGKPNVCFLWKLFLDVQILRPDLHFLVTPANVHRSGRN